LLASIPFGVYLLHGEILFFVSLGIIVFLIT